MCESLSLYSPVYTETLNRFVNHFGKQGLSLSLSLCGSFARQTIDIQPLCRGSIYMDKHVDNCVPHKPRLVLAQLQLEARLASFSLPHTHTFALSLSHAQGVWCLSPCDCCMPSCPVSLETTTSLWTDSASSSTPARR